jgi:O-antigen/teichoic acid export membrane protein
MKFARNVFLAAGIYGLVVMLPQYFLEARIGRDTPPPITHPEFFYGFIGVTIAWQVVFLIISRDPQRYRTLMIAGVLEKAVFVIAVAVLFAQNRVTATVLAPAGIDLVLGVLFIISFLKTRDANAQH